MSNFRTPQEAANDLKNILGDQKNNSTGVGKDIENQPDRKSDTPVGIRHGELKEIDPTKIDGFNYKVYFPETNSNAYAKMSGTLSVITTPNGSWKNGVYKISETTKVSCKAIKDTLKWEIVGFDNDLNITPGATVIERGDSKIVTHNDQVTVTKGDTKIEVKGDWAYLNGKKICVEGGNCGGGSSNFWIQPMKGYFIVSYENNAKVYDLATDEWVDTIPLSGIKAINPTDPQYFATDGCAYQVDMGSGGLAIRDAFPGNTVTEFFSWGDYIMGDKIYGGFINSSKDSAEYGTFVDTCKCVVYANLGVQVANVYKNDKGGTLVFNLDNGNFSTIDIPETPIRGPGAGYIEAIPDVSAEVTVTVFTINGAHEYSLKYDVDRNIVEGLKEIKTVEKSLVQSYDGYHLGTDGNLYGYTPEEGFVSVKDNIGNFVDLFRRSCRSNTGG